MALVKSNPLITIVASVGLLFSCSVQRVLRSPEKTEKVVYEWHKSHPPEIDTQFVKGKDTTILKEVVKYDSVPLPYPVNHRYTEVRYLDRLVTDTVKIYIQDTAMIGILERKIDQQNSIINELREDVKSLRGFKTGVLFLVGILFLIGVFLVLKRFRIL